MTDHAYCEKVLAMETLLKGNGHEGYFEKVDQHEIFFQNMKGVFKFVGFIGIANIIAIVAVLFKLFGGK